MGRVLKINDEQKNDGKTVRKISGLEKYKMNNNNSLHAVSIPNLQGLKGQSVTGLTLR